MAKNSYRRRIRMLGAELRRTRAFEVLVNKIRAHHVSWAQNSHGDYHPSRLRWLDKEILTILNHGDPS